MTKTKTDVYQEIVRQSQSLPGNEAERTTSYVTAHPEVYAEYSRAPLAPTPKPSPLPAPITLAEAKVDFAITRSRKTAERLIDLKARALASKEPVSYQEAVGRILATEPGLATAYYGGARGPS